MIRLALASIRRRTAGVLATLVAVAVGTALVAACGGVFETALRLQAPPQRLAGTPVVVSPRGEYTFADGSDSTALPERPALSAGDLQRIARVPGVRRVVADVSFSAVVVRDGRPVGDAAAAGHPWSSAALTPYRLHGAPPRAAGDVVLDAATARAAGVHAGARVRLVVAGVTRTAVVTGVATAARLVRGPALFFASAGGTAPRSAGVLASPGTSRGALTAALRRDLPDTLRVRVGDDRGNAEFAGIAGSRLPLIILAGVLGGLVVVVMGIVVAATITLTVRRRRRELALLRATGGTPAQVRRLVVAEALLVGGFGALAGALLGRFVGRTLFAGLTGHGVVPRALAFHQGPVPYATAAVVALVAVRVSAGLAARPAARVAPVEAMREADLPRVSVGPLQRVLAGSLAAGTVGLAVTTMFLSPENATALGGPAVLTGALAVALVAPAAVRALARRAARKRLAGRGATGRLATTNLWARAVQYGAVLTPVTIATAIALGNVYSQTTQDDAARAAYLDRLHADVVVGSDAGGLAPGAVDRLARLPHVDGASALVTSHGWLEKPFDDAHTSDPLRLLGLSAQRGRPVYTGPVTRGHLRDLRPGTVALPAGLAADLHVALGRRVTVRLGDGARVTVKVVAVLDQPDGYQQLVLPAAVLAAHVDAHLVTDVALRTDRPAAVASEAARLALPGARVGGPARLRAQFDAALGVEAWINYLIAALALAYAAIAVVNTLAVSVLDRRREFGLQRLVGATAGEVRRMLHREVALVGVAGWAAGAVISVFTIWPIAVASGSALPSGPWWVLGASALATVVLLAPVTEVTARIAMRRPAAEVVAEGDA